MHRRSFLLNSLLAAYLRGEETSADPWKHAELLKPEELAKMLNADETHCIICVTFPVLYRQKHIPGARLAGPTNKPEGIAALRAAVSGLHRDAEIVIYCGCCPMKNCPNVRPAYGALRRMKFSDIRVLDLPTNFHTDWETKGYPVEG